MLSTNRVAKIGIHLLAGVVLCSTLLTGAAQATDTAGEESGRVLESIRIQPPGHVAPLRFGMLLSGQGDVGSRQSNMNRSGFRVTDARLLLAGELEGDFGYLVQADLIRSAPLLDLVMDWKSETWGTKISTGFFRSAFSAELLIAAPHLDFIERSQAVRALAPSRQVGVQLDQMLVGEVLVARLGVFNGEGSDLNNDNELLYTLRLDGRVPCGDDDSVLIQYGINGAYSSEDQLPSSRGPGGLNNGGAADGNTLLAGADLRISKGPVFFSTEALYGSFSSSEGPTLDAWGYQASVGWKISRLVQILARYDSFKTDVPNANTDLAIASLVLNFTKYVNLQVELRVPTLGEKPTPGGAASFSVQF